MINSTFLGVLNGVIGDYLEKKNNPLAVSMDLYYKKQPLKGDLSTLKNDHAKYNGNACLFLHGSADSEQGWLGTDNYNYGTNLYESLNILPLYLRYNSGLHISENGKLLAKLLNEYLAKNDIKNLSVIGHSMGGLIFRSACYYAEINHYNWLEKVDHVFYIGSPHHGAPLEKFGAWTHAFVKKINNPVTDAISKLIDIRSDGIKDLRHGYIIDEEWLEDQKDHFPKNRKINFPLTSNTDHYVIAATLRKNINSVISNWIGDIMVQKDSALGKSDIDGHHLDFREENILILGGSSHVKLRHHPKVNNFLLEKLAGLTA
ncbi:MAG: hypothetical protein R2753_08785 [Chitinophagales bacterium]